MWIANLAMANPPDTAFESELRFQHSYSEQFLRRYLSHTLNRLPYAVYRPIVDIVKRLRGLKHVQREYTFQAGSYSHLFSEQEPKVLQVVLTHDIDTTECARFWPEVIKVEEKYGVKSCSNVLTQGPYRLEKPWLDELEARGFEIGLHGDNHDAGIGFRTPEEIKARLERCLDDLGRSVIGYRAPVLGISEQLLSILSGLGFRYDSSILVKHYYRNGIPACHPYLYPDTNIWQLPLAVQDDGLFRDKSMSEAEALQLLRSLMFTIEQHNGLFVFNSHPIHLQQHIGFYERFLAYLKDANISVILPGDLVKQLDEARREL